MAKNKRWGIIGGIVAFLMAMGGKLKFLLPLLKLLKLGKVGGTVWSMLLMVGTYALIYPWSFAIGLVMMLFIHEMGHVWAAKRRQLPVSAPAFIPFLGALITMKKQPQDAETEAYIAYGGPLIGTIGAVLALVLGFLTNYSPLFIIAWVGFFLNLINLLPIHPLDGGRIVTAISRWLWVVGLVGGLFVILYLRAFIFLFFWLLFAWELYQTYVRKRKRKEFQAFEPLQVERRLFEENYIPVPGAYHTRKLDFAQYSTIVDQRPVVDIYYPGIGRVGSFSLPHGVVKEVILQGTEADIVGEKVVLKIGFKYEPYAEHQMIKDDAYYQVSPKTRLIYGVAYFGLAALLGWLMLFAYQAAPTPPMVG